MTQMIIQQFSSKFWWISDFKCVARSLILHQLMGKFVVIFFVASAVQPDGIPASEPQVGHADIVGNLFVSEAHLPFS